MISALSSSQHASHTLYNAPSCSYSTPHSSSATPPPPRQRPSGHSSSPDATSMQTRPFVSSPRQMFRVYGYGPQEGTAGTCLVVQLQFHPVSQETTFLRIVVGNRALATDVHPTPGKCEGEWDLRAVVPELEALSSNGAAAAATVPVTVQALNASNCTIDSLTFGSFTYARYNALSGSPLLQCKQESHDDLHSLRAEYNSSPSSSMSSPATVARKRPRPSSAGTVRSRAINSTTGPRDAGARGQLKKQSLIRARRSSTDDDDPDSAFRASLVLETPTEALARVQEWDAEEQRIGRRLVRFSRVQEGCTLRVTCEPIRASAYKDGETVVSCIFRPPDWVGAGDPPASQCCITSVDIIFLLECLVGDLFNIEEKNRIRRNLEGFRPKTVSKNKAGTEEFFQKIMDFPAPKPRNIEKDVKVFDWAVLPQALDKIISKYTLLPAVLKQEVTDAQSISSRSTPQIPQASIAPSYPTSTSPVPDIKPDTTYAYHQPAYRTSYTPTAVDGLENTFAAATILPAADHYDSYITHSHSPSPTPLLSTPSDSPLASAMMPLSYSDPSPSLYPPVAAYVDQSTYSSTYAPLTYNTTDYRRAKMPDMPGSHTYM